MSRRVAARLSILVVAAVVTACGGLPSASTSPRPSATSAGSSGGPLPTTAALSLTASPSPSPRPTPLAQWTPGAELALPTPIVPSAQPGACGWAAAAPTPGPDVIQVWFTCEGGRDPLQGQFGMAAVGRQVDAAATSIERLAAKLQALLAGPTALERGAGLISWFSDETAGALRSVTVQNCGAVLDGSERWAVAPMRCRGQVLTVVDFADFSDIIPAAAATEEAAQMLLGELHMAVIDSAADGWLFRFDGDCDAFWNWLPLGARGGGAGCLVMSRG